MDAVLRRPDVQILAARHGRGLVADAVRAIIAAARRDAGPGPAGASALLDRLPERLEEAVLGLAALGFEGANVTTPHKLAVTALCETDSPSVNTLVVRGGHIEGRTTDAAILAGLAAERPVVLGDG
ncbi:MAG TPA: hypothetical protein VFP98_02125, partial [Candidatus Polarisedimenticolia bacterium]|nr:hypothetical protein [Candidatus Polarisedimenticolia bacterium]